MANLSFKEFMEQVEEHLRAYPPETLRKILIEWAKNTRSEKSDRYRI